MPHSKEERMAAAAERRTKSVGKELVSDVAKGQELFGKEFKEGALGRLDVERTADVSDVIKRRRAGLEGLSAEENQALRERAGKGIERGTQTALRQLRGIQGARGVRGGSAVARQTGVLRAGIEAKAGVERDLFIANIAQKRQALGAFESSILGAEATERAGSIFNLEQRGRETAGRLTAGLGFAGIASAERTGIRSAAAAGAAGGGSKK